MVSQYLTLSEPAREQYLFGLLNDPELVGEVIYHINHPRLDRGRTYVEHTRICPVCGAPFHAHKKSQQSCSHSCGRRLGLKKAV